MNNCIHALVFDCDGVVVDSNRLHVETWRETAAAHGYPMADPEHIGKCGLRTIAVIRDLLRWPVDEEEAVRLGEEKESRYRECIRAGGIEPIAGVRETLEKAAALGLPCALGSSAPRENARLCLESLGLVPFFKAVVTGEDVERGKPHPDIFLAAARKLGVPPEECLVIEDAPAGVEAAHRAGMRAIALLTSHTPEELAAADALARDFLDPAFGEALERFRGKCIRNEGKSRRANGMRPSFLTQPPHRGEVFRHFPKDSP